MRTVDERSALLARYPGPAWEKKVNKMSDAQVHAVYMRFVNQKKESSK